MKIKIGDYVKVKEGTKDPDFDMFLIGGYQGRVFSIEKNSEETLIEIKWDKQTLLKMPKIMRNRFKNEDLEPEIIHLLSDEVEIISSGVR